MDTADGLTALPFSVAAKKFLAKDKGRDNNPAFALSQLLTHHFRRLVGCVLCITDGFLRISLYFLDRTFGF